jgi:hypothetical protein
VIGLSGAWIVIFLLFLLLMVPAYRSSFFSTQTCKEWACSFFTKEGATDRSKMDIHSMRRALWKHIRADVKEWTLANWERIEEEGPDWFSEGLIGQIEDDMIPPAALARLKNKGGGERRRSSLGDQILGRSNQIGPVNYSNRSRAPVGIQLNVFSKSSPQRGHST